MPDNVKENEPDPAITQLAGTAVTTARGVRGQSWFVGWSKEGLPAATASARALSDEARAALASYRASGLPAKQIAFSALMPVNYVLTGSAIDFADLPDRRAEDQVTYTVEDASGARRDIALGELGVLTAIAAARPPWQSMGGQQTVELAVGAVAMYTLFAPLPGHQPDLGLAMLFEPPIPGAPNEAVFRSMVRNTIGRLLVLDESQPPEQRKGYLDMAGRLAGTPPKGSLLQSLLFLRKAGFVEFSDDWMRSLQRAGGKVQSGALRLIRALGLVDVDDAVIAELSDHRPDYDVDRLDTNRLLDLAEHMAWAARQALG